MLRLRHINVRVRFPDSRAAFSVSGHQPAEAVGREVNGSSVREHVDGAVGGWASASSQDATKPHTLKAGTSSTEVKVRGCGFSGQSS